MSYQDYHGHSFEVSFRKMSCGLQGLEVFQTLARHLSTKSVEYKTWKLGRDEAYAESMRCFKGDLVCYNAMDYRWRRQEAKVVDLRTGKARYVELAGFRCWEPDDYVYSPAHPNQRRLQRVIVALDGPLMLTDPNYSLKDRMRTGGFIRGLPIWVDYVYEDILAKLEACVEEQHLEFLRIHFPWLLD